MGPMASGEGLGLIGKGPRLSGKGLRLSVSLALLLLQASGAEAWLFSLPALLRSKGSGDLQQRAEQGRGRIGAVRPARPWNSPKPEAEVIIDAYSVSPSGGKESTRGKMSRVFSALKPRRGTKTAKRLSTQTAERRSTRTLSPRGGKGPVIGGPRTPQPPQPPQPSQPLGRSALGTSSRPPARGELRAKQAQRLRVADRTKIGTLDVPHLGIGTIAWSPSAPGEEERFEVIAKTAMHDGLSLFDTAERYGAKGLDLIPAAIAATGLPVKRSYLGGDTESRLAAWAEGGTVITKFAPTPWRGDSQSVVEACRGSAERLGVESVDLMQVHMPDIIQPFKPFGIENRREEAHWDGLAECYHSGLAKNVGVSNYGPTLLARCHKYLAAKGVPLASNQIHLNLLYRRQGSLATVEACQELGVACLAYYPLAMGLLTGKLCEERLEGRTDSRSVELLRYMRGGKGGGFPNTAGDIPDGGVAPLVEVLERVAARLGKSPAQVSLNWIISKGAIPIPGASSVAQLRENAGALNWRLSPEDMAELEGAADGLGFEFNGCGFQTADSKFVGYGFEKWRLD